MDDAIKLIILFLYGLFTCVALWKIAGALRNHNLSFKDR